MKEELEEEEEEEEEVEEEEGRGVGETTPACGVWKLLSSEGIVVEAEELFKGNGSKGLELMMTVDETTSVSRSSGDCSRGFFAVSFDSSCWLGSTSSPGGDKMRAGTGEFRREKTEEAVDAAEFGAEKSLGRYTLLPESPAETSTADTVDRVP